MLTLCSAGDVRLPSWCAVNRPQPEPTAEVVEAPRPSVERSPSDILRLVVAAVVLVVLLIVQGLFGNTIVEFTADLLNGLAALPTWILDTLVIGTRILAVVVLVGGLVLTIRHGRWRMLITVTAAALLAVGLAAVLDTFDPDDGTSVIEIHDALGPLSATSFPTALGVAAIAAIMTAAAPWLSRRWRRVGWLLVLGVTVTRFISSPVAFDSWRNALVGWFAGALVLVVLGGPLRRPTAASIAAGLGAVGAPLARLEPASVDARGSTPYFGAGRDGRPLFVKALSEDQRSADLLFRLYRWLNRRDLGDERPFSSLRRTVEHEALVALAARDLGIRTPRLVGLATADPNSFVLAYEAIEGRSLDRLQPEEVTDELLAAIWDGVVQLRQYRIAHRDLRLANVFVAADGEVWLIDFGFSELAASSLLLTTDVAELLASSTLQVGPERAVALAHAAVGADVLDDALKRLHPWALSGATRTGLKAQRGLLDELRRRVEAAPNTT